MNAMKQHASTTAELDYTLLILIIGLQAFGLIMMFSSSYPTSFVTFKGNFMLIALKQLLWVGLGLTSMVIAMNIDYRFWQKSALPLTILILVALTAVLFFGKEVNNSTRAIGIGPMDFQPSEFAKITTSFYIAAWITSKGDRIRDVGYGLIPFSVILGLLVSLIIIEPDLSTSLVIVVAALAMFIIAGADIFQIGFIFGLFGLVAALLVSQFSHAQDRIRLFAEAFSNPFQSSSPQIKNGIMALYEGGWFGKGLAASEYKHGAIPLVHSDSIFAIIGEELGIIGGLIIILLFLFFAYRGVRTALHAQDAFGTLLAVGITSWIVGQAFLNIAVVTATFPYTGIPLPFFSYGGSSTLANLTAMGILLNISRNGRGGFNLNANPRLWRRNRRSRVSDTHRGRSPQKSGATAYARNKR